MKSVAATAALALALGGCFSGNDVGPDDVIRIEACPPEGVACDAAALVADGKTPIGIKVSSPAKAPRTSPLDATVTISAGTWVAAASPGQPTIAKVSLAAQDSRILAFTPPTATGYLQVSAELAGFTSTLFLLLKAAPLAAPDVELNPAVLGTGNSLRLTARVRAASGGLPSDGSRVAFLVDDVIPPSTLAFFSPTESELHLDHTASSTLTVDGTVTGVHVRVRAIPPDASIPPADTTIGVVRP